MTYEEFPLDEIFIPISRRAINLFKKFHMPKFFKKLSLIQREEYTKNANKLNDDLKSHMNRILSEITPEQMSNKIEMINLEFINRRLFELKTQKDNKMLKDTLNQKIKDLPVIYQRKLSKFLANKFFINNSQIEIKKKE